MGGTIAQKARRFINYGQLIVDDTGDDSQFNIHIGVNKTPASICSDRIYIYNLPGSRVLRNIRCGTAYYYQTYAGEGYYKHCELAAGSGPCGGGEAHVWYEDTTHAGGNSAAPGAIGLVNQIGSTDWTEGKARYNALVTPDSRRFWMRAYLRVTDGTNPLANMMIILTDNQGRFSWGGITDASGKLDITQSRFGLDYLLGCYEDYDKVNGTTVLSSAGSPSHLIVYDPAGAYGRHYESHDMSSDWGSPGSYVDIALSISSTPVITNPTISTGIVAQSQTVEIECDVTLTRRAFVLFTDENDLPVYSKEMIVAGSKAKVSIFTGNLPAATYSAGRIEIHAINEAGTESDLDETLALEVRQSPTPPITIDYGFTYEKKKAIYDLIPTSFTVRDKSIATAVRYANQWEKDAWPAIILEYTTITGNVYTPDNLRRVVTNIMEDDIEYDAAEDTYALQYSGVKEVISIIGTKSGGSFEFTSPTDYLIVNDEVVWQGGGSKPDDGTKFYVNYKAEWVRTLVGGEKFANLSVNIMAKDHKTDDDTFINGVVLADDIAAQLHHFFEFQLEAPAGCLTITQPEIRNLDELEEGEYARRRQFDVHIRYLEKFETSVVSIEEVDEEVNIDV